METVKLYDRERRLLHMRLRERSTWEAVGHELGVTAHRAKQIERHILQRLLTENGGGETAPTLVPTPTYGCGICGGVRVGLDLPSDVIPNVTRWLETR